MLKILNSLANSTILILFLAFNALSRLVLLSFALYEGQVDFNILDFLQVMGLGVINDLVAAFYILAPLAFLALLVPKNKSKILKSITYCFYFFVVLALGFLIISEFTFWLEFSTRFNFIAVDYLVYTHEVIGNITQSYPVPLILSLLFFSAVIIYYNLHSRIRSDLEALLSFREKLVLLVSLSCIVTLSFSFYNPKITDVKENNYLNELSKNGLYNLFSAFRNNSIDYLSFYSTRDQDLAFKELSNYITLKDQELIEPKLLERHIEAKGPQKNYNVVLITIESLSSEFLTNLVNDKSITPVINDLIEKSLYFDRFYATGTRTIRGLEAITLSIPPMPGQSMVRRPNNENLFSIATVLNKENYALKFIYGGYGYFDNMNQFFSKNGFKIWDRSNIPSEEISFENIWGISDEDLYLQVIKQADQSYLNKEKFFSLVMTTSNHRPYTYPEGKIDIPSKTGRHGGVKYTDYALGEFFKIAKGKPWFDSTIFVVVADHCAGSAGKTALPPEKYRIPLFIYAPKIISPGVVSKVAGQIDIAPTILALLNIEYDSRFFGNDILSKTYQNSFISTFQKLGYIENNKLVVLSPGKIENTYKLLDNDRIEATSPDKALINRAINYYQSAYYLYQNGMLKQDVKINKDD
ncbi:MAG: LTA synthase family protein [Rickettsiales bacterium]|jgi:phosphoglycerol transferase MdoB-like AlkP superfamily enzyme|nr:LTA synthase family protein [Rickettsiales bacterium]